MENRLSRRKFLNTAAASAALAAIPFNYGFRSISAAVKDSKPNSKFGGVQIGAITYSWRSMPSTPTDIISYCQQADISDLELMGNVAEDYLGLPQGPARPPRDAVQTEEQKAKFEKELAVATDAQRKWRIALPMQKYTDLRKLFNDAGINIHIVKFSPANWTDEEIDYAFNAAKAMGAKGVTNETSCTLCRKA